MTGHRATVHFSQNRVCTYLLSLILPAAFLAGCSTGVKQASSEKTVYQQVMRAGTIRCAYLVDPPGCLKDPNTRKLTGIGVEAMELVGKKLGLKVAWTEEVSWGTMLEGLESGRYDIIATPIWPNASRARVADFTKALYFSPVFAYAKVGSPLLKTTNIETLNSPKHSVVSIDGATPEVIAREDFPAARLVALPQQCEIAELLLSVSSGKGELTFAEPAAVARYAKFNPNTVERIPTGAPLRVFPDCWAIKRGQMEFKSMVDTTIDQLNNSGVIAKLISKYEPAPNTLFRVAPPYVSPYQK